MDRTARHKIKENIEGIYGYDVGVEDWRLFEGSIDLFWENKGK